MGTHFVISNQDSFNWVNVELQLNPGLITSGYKRTAAIIEAGSSISIGAREFAKSDGERFNPSTHRAQSISISCDTPKGKGFYSGDW